MYTVHSDNIADLEATRLITSSIERPTLLDAGSLPIEELASIAFREGKRPCPVYGTHKWFARRFSSAFRALLIAASIESKADFWAAYQDGIDWSGRTVLDPFVGGGTSVVEAQRLGANTIGLDVDAVAAASRAKHSELPRRRIFG
jgi:putative DNA methylase